MAAAGRRLRIAKSDAWILEPDEAGPLLLWLSDGEAAGAASPMELATALAADAGRRVCVVECVARPRFPAPLSEAYHCAEAIAGGEVEELEPVSALAVGGDHLAAGVAVGVALLARRYGGPALTAQALVAPVLDARLASPSWQRGPDAERRRLAALFRDYAPGLEPTDPLLSPLFESDLGRLPPAAIATFREDGCRDDGERYAARLGTAGVPVLGNRYEGTSDSDSTLLRAATGVGRALDAIWSGEGGKAPLGSSR